jgi:two-component system, LuxR family, response regulator FixJ
MTIALIEDDDAVLHSLRLLLQNRGFAVASFKSAEAFLASPQGRSATCIVSDVRLPGKSGVDLQRMLAANGVETPIILITGHGDIAMAVTAMREGASDFIEKPYDAERLIASIERVQATKQRLKFLESERQLLSQRAAELSPRQREVMDLVAVGLSSKQIAARLRISHRTVENYRAWIMERMDAANVAELVRKVLILEAGNTRE